MNELLLSLALAFHAGPFRAETLGFSTTNFGVQPNLVAGRLLLEPPGKFCRPYIGMTAMHRVGSQDPADISGEAGVSLLPGFGRISAGWVGTELEETFAPKTDGGAQSAFMIRFIASDF